MFKQFPFIIISFFVLLLTLILSGCASSPEKSQSLQSEVPVEVPMPYAEPEKKDIRLSEDILFHYLLGDIAAQRGQFTQAYNSYMHTAMLADESDAARKATQIAIFQKNDTAALNAVKQWVRLSPNSIAARSAAGVLYLRKDDFASALGSFIAVIKISEALDKDGFLVVAVSLSKEPSPVEGRQLMEALLQQYESDKRMHYAHAVYLGAQKQYPETLAQLDKALALEPGWDKALLLKVKILIEQEKIDESIALLESALDDNADAIDLRLIYAKLLVTKDHALAYREFKRLHALAPEKNDVISALGILAEELDDFAEAKKWWAILLQQGGIDEKSTAAYHLGQIEENQGKLGQALAYYQQVNHGLYLAEAQLRQADILARQGELAQSRQMLESLRISDPDNSVSYYLSEAIILHDYGTSEEVYALYDVALKAHPGSMKLVYARGVYSAEVKHLEKAEKDLRLVLEKEPENADALNALGYTLADQTDRYQEALALIKKAYALKPENAAILDSMGWVNYKLGNYREAESFLIKALSINNDDEIAAHLGEVLWMKGQKDRAQNIWGKALKDFPESDKLSDVIKRLTTDH